MAVAFNVCYWRRYNVLVGSALPFPDEVASVRPTAFNPISKFIVLMQVVERPPCEKIGTTEGIQDLLSLLLQTWWYWCRAAVGSPDAACSGWSRVLRVRSAW